MGPKEYDFNKQIRSIEDGFETNLPKRLDIIALGFAEKYDYVIYNDKLDFAVKQLEAIYLAEQKKREICK